MDKITINLNNKIHTQKSLKIKSLLSINGRIRVELDEEETAGVNLKVGDSLSFSRYFSDESIESFSSNVTVQSIVDDYNFFVTAPQNINGVLVMERSYDSKITDGWKHDDEERTVDFTLTKDLGVYKEDVATVLRNRRLGDVVITLTNPVKRASVIVENPTIITSSGMTTLRLTIKKEEYEIINSYRTVVTASVSNYYVIDKENSCHLWSEYEDTCGVRLSINNQYYNVPIIMDTDCDYVGLSVEENEKTIIENEYKGSLIPEVIDYEKVKFTPVIPIGNNSYIDCQKVRFKFHFRKRDESSKEWNILSGETKPWNYDIDENEICGTSQKIFKSDMLGRLGFTDDDIAYQKMKVKKTFARLVFYNSKEFANQSIISYSTVFLDSTELRNKYIKLLNNKDITYDRLVDFTGDTKNGITYDDCLNSEIYVTNSFNEKKSSEGFYFYMFKSDAPLENEEKTIYMKVEFNHAKYGRTIPMLSWPLNSGGTGEYLTPYNYADSIYIPVKISYINGRYVYWFEDGAYREDKNADELTIPLFEPRLTVQLTKPE